MFEGAKAGEVGPTSDKVWASPPPGVKMLGRYICLGLPFPGFSPNTVISVDVIEAENAEAMAAVAYPQMLVGASIWYVPVLEMPTADVGKLEFELKR